MTAPAELLAGDLAETSVRIEVPSKGGGTIFSRCVVQHLGDDVIRVVLPSDWQALATAAGIPSHATCFDGYLETLARIEFARSGR